MDARRQSIYPFPVGSDRTGPRTGPRTATSTFSSETTQLHLTSQQCWLEISWNLRVCSVKDEWTRRLRGLVGIFIMGVSKIKLRLRRFLVLIDAGPLECVYFLL